MLPFLPCWWRRWCAGLTDLHGVAEELLWVLGLVLLAGVVRDTVVVRELVDASWVAAVAGTASVAVYDDLRGEGHTWEGVVT